MEWMNYHHLLYFWTVVREGGVVRAAERLHLSQPTISSQIRSLEEAFGERLLARVGRNVVPTDVGQLVYRYADEIFSLGRELQDAVKARPTGRPVRLTVGIADVVSKLIAYRLLSPALESTPPIHLVCREDRADRLLAALSTHELDLVISDSPVPPTVHVKAYNHVLGECGVTIFGTSALAKRLRKGFPKSLQGAPMLVPGEGTLLRRQLEDWFRTTGHRPMIVGEFDDSALLKVFGENGAGVFAGPTVIEDEIRKQYNVVSIGRVDTIREKFFAISFERRLKHPGVSAIAQRARLEMFSAEANR